MIKNQIIKPNTEMFYCLPFLLVLRIRRLFYYIISPSITASPIFRLTGVAGANPIYSHATAG